MARRQLSDVQRLGRRVAWLDRYRRALAVTCSAAVAVLVAVELYDGLGPAWSRYHAGLLGMVIGFFAWVALEVSLAWVTALWETEASRMVRSRGLPRAVLLRRKSV